MRQTLPRAAGGLRCAPWRGPRESWAGQAGAELSEGLPSGAEPMGVGVASQTGAVLQVQEGKAGKRRTSHREGVASVDGFLFAVRRGVEPPASGGKTGRGL